MDPHKDILITVGTMQVLDLAARAFLTQGNEVIVFELFYVYYRNLILQNGGKMVTVPLRVKNGTSGQSSSDWTFDRNELESKVTNKTKLILFNNPNNPLGKVKFKLITWYKKTLNILLGIYS